MPARRKSRDTEALRSAIAAAARATLDLWLAEGQAEDAEQVNRGLCGDFAGAILESLEDAPDGVTEVDVAMFTKPDDDFFEGAPFDRKLLRKHWPAVVPPEGLSWDDMDELSAGAGFNPGTHVWVTDGRFHYDSECPEGTENFLELPFFKRVIASWVEEREATPSP